MHSFVSCCSLYPGDLYPFTRKPFFIIVDSDNSFVFQHVPRYFGQPLVILMSPQDIPPAFQGRLNTLGAYVMMRIMQFCDLLMCIIYSYIESLKVKCVIITMFIIADIKMFHMDFVGICMIYLHTKFHLLMLHRNCISQCCQFLKGQMTTQI